MQFDKDNKVTCRIAHLKRPLCLLNRLLTEIEVDIDNFLLFQGNF